MQKSIRLIHKYLDGEMSSEEITQFEIMVAKDEHLKKHLDQLRNIIENTGKLEKITPSPDFTQGVMMHLPDTPIKVSNWQEKVLNWLFQSRTLRWNITSALASVIVLAILFTGLLIMIKPPNLSQPNFSPLSSVDKDNNNIVYIRFVLYTPGAYKVSLIGDFNDWKTDDILLKSNQTDVWTALVPLPRGKYQYGFLIDGEKWMPDPSVRTYVQDGFGNINSIIDLDDI
ncbi:MAG: isoamylase early set domain-containing protein [Planctomycetota bacterium]